MWGVESTRAFSNPRKLIATSLVTSSFCSPFVPTGIFAMASGGGQPGEDAAHIAERALHPGQRVLGVDLVLEVDTALVVHLLELLEQADDRQDAVADVTLAVL